jgi:hypothetical protein
MKWYQKRKRKKIQKTNAGTAPPAFQQRIDLALKHVDISQDV